MSRTRIMPKNSCQEEDDNDYCVMLNEIFKSSAMPQARRDWYVYAILSTLSCIGKEVLMEEEQEKFDHFLIKIQIYLNKRNKKHHPALRVWSRLGSSPRGISRLLMDTTLTMLPLHYESYSYPLPNVVFRMFDYTDCLVEESLLPKDNIIARFLIEEHLQQIIYNYSNRRVCAEQLLDVPFKTNIPLNYCIVEVIFSELFRLPTPEYPKMYYNFLLIDLCELQPLTMSPVLVQATEILFRHIDGMAITIFDRFVDWFAYHLSSIKLY